jgi:glutathione peroxidase
MRELAILAAAMLLMTGASLRAEDKQPASVHDFTVKDIDGKPVDLSKYKGKVVMIVNVASKCGNTPQYANLEKIYEAKKDKGFVVLGFPANEFGKQEPGTDAEIKDFCTSTYDVKFDMFSKVVVKGEGQAPLFQYLTSKQTDPKFAGDIKWNFTKFLVSRDGKVVARYEPKTKPDEKKVLDEIDAELAKGN